MAWLSLSVAIVGWLVGAFVVLTLRGKHMSRRFAVLVLMLSTFGAGAVQYVLYRGVDRTKRLSAARLVGVTSVRMQDDSDFIRKYLIASGSQQQRGEDIDWVVTFKEKSADISATLAAVERNAYIRENYSVWLGDLEFRRDQLDRAAERTARAAEGKPRQTNVESYLGLIDLTANLLDGLAREMRTHRPNLYYGEH